MFRIPALIYHSLIQNMREESEEIEHQVYQGTTANTLTEVSY